ncbi:hypothetical protein GIB67_007495 [Kingdonia uniflora]|uniref:Uncharacterized protein n=1 Tax=Kingdonia uniflora TaxID=39325 RepID=A0A7J7LVU5_9MAGN|nr:hypothetical protein GIB67_007495 [Kingdonia uniflora]
MAPRVSRKMLTTRGKRVPMASLRKRLNGEQEDPSHPNYNNPPRIPTKRVKTCSTRVLVRDSSISGSVPRVSVTPEEDSSQGSSAVESSSTDSQGTLITQSSTNFFVEHEKFPSAEVSQPENFPKATLEQQRTTTTEEEVLPGDRNSEQGAGEYYPRNPSLLTSFATHRAKVLVLGQLHKTNQSHQGVWHLALKCAIEGGDFEDTEDPTWEELSRQFTKLLTIAQEGPKGEYEDDIILSGRGEYQERIDSRLKKIDHKTNLRQTLFQPFNWFQLDIRDVERDGNTTFRVAASYAYKSQMKFLNVKDSLCTLMMNKPSYWKSVFSRRPFVGNILREGGHLHQQQGGLNVPTFVLAENKQQDYQREEV